MKIYIQIAAYRDPELVPTIRDCLARAKYKRDLRFGICWQKDEADISLRSFAKDKRFRIDEVEWHASKGLCWARARLQKLHDAEDYTLQLDSHHRFAHHWDEKLLKYLELSGSPKPIITTYAGMYNPATKKKINNDPFKMVADHFTPAGTIFFRPHTIEGWRELKKPVPARFVSGHFFFTLGSHCQEYKYDPNLYFAGDEISLSIRSYTLGYDLFHPHRTVVWHEYIRDGRVKHWDDHTSKNKHLVDVAWHERDAVSKRRLRKMLQEEDNDEDISGFGLGNIRSHQDYERYAGIDFSGRRLQKETVQGVFPPCRYINDQEWEKGFFSNNDLDLKWDVGRIEKCDDYHFIYFAVEDNLGHVIYRYDAKPGSPEAQFSVSEKKINIRSERKPAKLVVWPVSKSRGWLTRVDYAL